jgi:low affinity Fe/Cu permease
LIKSKIDQGVLYTATQSKNKAALASFPPTIKIVFETAYSYLIFLSITFIQNVLYVDRMETWVDGKIHRFHNFILDQRTQYQMLLDRKETL